MLDNCYGEFVEFESPLKFGVDLMAGSMIKNPGGAIARTGGYIAGKKEYADNPDLFFHSYGKKIIATKFENITREYFAKKNMLKN